MADHLGHLQLCGCLMPPGCEVLVDESSPISSLDTDALLHLIKAHLGTNRKREACQCTFYTLANVSLQLSGGKPLPPECEF